MSRLHFRDIQDWTPASVSIVDKPYHPLALFGYEKITMKNSLKELM